MKERENRELVERLRGFTTPELCDGAGFYHSMDHRIKPRVGKKRIAGTAVTVDVPAGEGDMVAEAILSLQEGDVLVVAGKGCCSCSYWGDFRSICAVMKKAEAVVIDGAYRDHEGCVEAGFPVFAKGLTCGTAAKNGVGAINVPINCGGVCVSPGDFIIGDENGVCVLKPEEAKPAMERALKKRELQKQTIEEMKKTGIVVPKLKKKLLDIQMNIEDEKIR